MRTLITTIAAMVNRMVVLLNWILCALLIAAIRLYQLVLSPFIGGQCRFYPSCSKYALQAIQRYGAIKGVYLTISRLLRCHPWDPGGHDPVP